MGREPVVCKQPLNGQVSSYCNAEKPDFNAEATSLIIAVLISQVGDTQAVNITANECPFQTAHSFA
jgi:hypothetical protein